MSGLSTASKTTGFIHIYGEWGTGSQEAEGTLTLDTQPTDGDTFTVDDRTYTFEDTLTDVDGNINIGGSLAQAQLNLVAAFDLSGVAGTDYATSMTEHDTVSIAAFATDDAVLTAKVGGTIGNSIVTTQTFTAGTNVFDAATLGTTTAGADTEVFERGNDVSGDGSAKAPYANIQEAVNQLKIYVVNELSSVLDQNYFMLLISESGESNDYSGGLNFGIATTAADGTDIPTGTYSGSTANKLIFQGWRKLDGAKATAAQVSNWVDVYDTEKPELSGSNIPMGTSTNGYKGPSFQIKDCILTYTGGGANLSLFTVSSTNLLNASTSTAFQLIGCIVRGGLISIGEFNTSNLQFRFLGVIACIVEMSQITSTVGFPDTRIFFQNCTFPNLVAGINYSSAARITVQGSSNIYRSSGFVSVATSTAGNFNGNFNVYNRVSAIAEDPSGTNLNPTLQDIIDSQTPSGDGVHQQHSFDADPTFTDFSGNDFTLQAGSIAQAPGGTTPGYSQSASVVDPDSKEWNQFDFLNNIWSDSQEEVLSLFGTISTIRTRRSAGCFQSQSVAAPDAPSVQFPTATTAGNPKYIVIEGNESPQGGTLQARIMVSNSSDFSVVASLVTIVDSVPINITASNNRIDFAEDGGGELNATLTVGIYSTAELLVEIKTQLDATGTGTYTVTYDGISGTNTELYTIAVAGGATTVQFFWHSGTNVATNAREILGFQQVDTTDIASHDSFAIVRENFYDASFTWLYADNTYTAGADPDVSGTWLAMGTGDPSAGGTPGTDGATGDGLASIRVDIPLQVGLGGKFLAGELWGGGKVGTV